MTTITTTPSEPLGIKRTDSAEECVWHFRFESVERAMWNKYRLKLRPEPVPFSVYACDLCDGFHREG